MPSGSACIGLGLYYVIVNLMLLGVTATMVRIELPVTDIVICAKGYKEDILKCWKEPQLSHMLSFTSSCVCW